MLNLPTTYLPYHSIAYKQKSYELNNYIPTTTPRFKYPEFKCIKIQKIKFS